MSNGTPQPEVSADLNAILFKYQPTGASPRTSIQDGLAQKGIIGVEASRKLAEADNQRVLAHKEKFIEAGQRFQIPPALLAGLASRESRGGFGLKNGFDASGNKFGLMQINKKYFTLQGTDDPFGLAHILQATEILKAGIDRVKAMHPDWPEERQLQGGVVAYSSGAGNVQTLSRLDLGTIGNDYSNDVWARAQFYAAEMDSSATTAPPAPVPVLPVPAPPPQLHVPAPPIADVEAGKSILQKNQQGDAVLELQNNLIKLNYLTLTEDQKKTGMGIFGPSTESALKEFQHDIYYTGQPGIYDAVTHLALRQIVDGSVRRGGNNNIGIVRRLQDRLISLGYLKQGDIATGYGTFGEKTEAALISFQQAQPNLASGGGALTPETVIALRASAPAPRPKIDLGIGGDDTKVDTQLPNGGPGFVLKSTTLRSSHFGTERTVNRLMAFAAQWNISYPGRPLRIGEMSRQGGGKFGQHKGEGHLKGFAVDIGLFRKDGQNAGTRFQDTATYDQRLTQTLVTALDQNPNVFLIVFNDPKVNVRPGSNKRRSDKRGIHDNHVHVEFRKRSY